MTALQLPTDPEPRIICAYCKADLGAAPASCPGDSHGICQECQALFFPEPADLRSWSLRARAEIRLRQLDREIQALDRQVLEKRTLQQSLIDQWGP